MLTFASYFIRYFMLKHSVKSIESKGRKGVLKWPLSIKNCSFLLEFAEAVGFLRAGKYSLLQESQENLCSQQGHTKAFSSLWVVSPGNYICWVLPWYMLFIMSLSTQQPLLKVLPFTCYLISVIRGQWIQPKVLSWLLSKQKLCIPWKSLFKWSINRDLPHTLARNLSSSMLLSWVVIVSLAASSLIAKDSSVGDVGNDPCVVSKPPGAPARDHILSRTLSSQKRKAVPPTGGSCSREKAGESVHGLWRGPPSQQGEEWLCQTWEA